MKSQKKKTTDIKLWHIINWLLEPADEIPQNFLDSRAKINSLVPYLVEQLWTHPNLISFLNEFNDLHNIPDGIEFLKILKKIFKHNKITKFDLYTFMPERNPDIIQGIMERENYDENNARSKYMLLLKLEKEVERYIKKAPNKKNLSKDPLIKETILSALEKEEENKKQNLPKSNFLTHLTQEVIDKHQLILFDVSLLRKTNQVLFIFIDAENKKWYYVTSFFARIYISSEEGILHNDYIENKDPEKFTEYIIPCIKSYTRLKYMLNDSYKRVLNLRD